MGTTSRLLQERPSWRHGVTNERGARNPVVAIDIASGRRDPMISVRESMRCRHCGTRLQHSLIDLGMSPLCESFLTQDQLDAPESYYPLHAWVCHSCWLVQLPEFVSPAHIFTE